MSHNIGSSESSSSRRRSNRWKLVIFILINISTITTSPSPTINKDSDNGGVPPTPPPAGESIIIAEEAGESVSESVSGPNGSVNPNGDSKSNGNGGDDHYVRRDDESGRGRIDSAGGGDGSSVNRENGNVGSESSTTTIVLSSNDTTTKGNSRTTSNATTTATGENRDWTSGDDDSAIHVIPDLEEIGTGIKVGMNGGSDNTSANAESLYPEPFKDFKMRQSRNRDGGSAKSRSGRSVCKISEYVCKSGRCISQDKYCNGVDDCGDGGGGSDEPLHCTPCNRTYYGEWGSTFSISLSSSTIAAALGLSHEQQGDQSQQPQDQPPELLDPLPLSPGSGGGKGRGKGESSSSSRPTQSSSSKKVAGPPQFVCQLTFAAAGDNFGDLVQVMFDSLNIGHFASPTHDGCPDGSLQVAEMHRPLTGGKWCGTGQGYSVYFSETQAIALTISVAYSNSAINGGGFGSGRFFTSGQNLMGGNSSNSGSGVNTSMSFGSLSSLPSGGSGNLVGVKKPVEDMTVSSRMNKPSGAYADDFEFKIRYKFIPYSLATVRYGTHGNPVERGEIVPGTYCSRDFESCHRRRCKVQSPNFPGLYPRNVSCFYIIRHREQLPCKRTLIQVSQLKGHKVQLKGPVGGLRTSGSSAGSVPQQPTSLLMQEDALVTWEDCAAGNRDSITIHDGSSLEDPILLVLCGGSHIPPVVSSSSEILVVFRATPFGNPLELKSSPPFPQPLRGFELDVDVIMVDSESADYSNFKDNCTFFFVSEPSDKCLMYKPQEHGGNWVAGRRGKVINPRHTIPPNTTCRYEFKGTKHEIVWIYFVSYSRSPSRELGRQFDGSNNNCTSRLTIKDGIDPKNEVLIGNFCDSDLPKLCDHKALQDESRTVRSCADAESYISAGPRMIVEQTFFEGTALRPINFHFHYEFVSRHTGNDGSCNRIYHLSKMKPKGFVRTTDNVFDFGRGGKSNLTCTYTFLLGSYDGLKLTIKNASFGDRPCRTVTDFESGRHICNYIAQPPTSESSGRGGSTSSSGSGMGPSATTRMSDADILKAGFPHRSELTIAEYIWPNINITAHKHCLCSNSSGNSGPTFTFLGRKVELVFKVEGMRARDSYENFFVHLEYEVVKGGGCRGDNHHMRTESGIISLESTFSHGPKVASCDHYPWLLEAKDNHSLYLRIPGYAMLDEKRAPPGTTSPSGGTSTTSHISPHQSFGPTPSFTYVLNNNNLGNDSSSSENVSSNALDTSGNLPSGSGMTKYHHLSDRVCPTTKNRIYIYDGENKLVQKICPSSISTFNTKKTPAQIVQLYSEDFGKFHSPLLPPSRSRFVIDFVGRELGSYQIKWLELISAKMKTTMKAMEYDMGSSKTTSSFFFGPARPVPPSSNVSVFQDGEQDQLQRKGKPSWDETLTELFKGQNGDESSSTNSIYSSSSGDGLMSLLSSDICPSYCPELKACISEKLWCDGEIHCPLTFVDENSCDNFWATLNQLLSPAVYIPVAAAALSALCCCGLVILCVTVKRMVVNMRDKGQLGIGVSSSSAASSRTSTVDRRIPQRDYFYDPHEPIS